MIITIIIIVSLRACGDDDDRSVTTTPRASTATTTTTTSPEPASSTPTTEVADPTPPPVEPVAPELQQILEGHCVPIEVDAVDDSSVARVELRPTETTSGPAAGDTPGPLGSGDPALDIVRTGVVPGGCPDAQYPILVAELGGPPDHVQVAAVFDLDPETGHVADPDAPDGIGRIAGWDLFCSIDPDGTIFVGDSEFNPVEGAVADRQGSYLAFAVSGADLDSFFDWNLQTFRRDGTTAEAPVDWNLASGRHEGGS